MPSTVPALVWAGEGSSSRPLPARLGRAQRLGEAPVHDAHLAVRPDEDVVGLHVPVDDAVRTCEGDGLTRPWHHVDAAGAVHSECLVQLPEELPRRHLMFALHQGLRRAAQTKPNGTSTTSPAAAAPGSNIDRVSRIAGALFALGGDPAIGWRSWR